MNKNNNTYLWLMLVVAAMVTTGCPTGEKDHDHDHDAGMHDEHDHDAGMHMNEDHDAGMHMEEEHDAGMEEVDDCTAAEAGDEMQNDMGQGYTCAPQEDEDMCFNSDYDWEIRCANEVCVETGELCFRHEDSLWYNECLGANWITSNCADADGHDADADSAVIYSMSYVETDDDDVATFIADIFYDGEGEMDTSLYTERLKLLTNGTAGLTYGAPTLTEGDTDGHYTLEFTLGVTSAAGEGEFAIYFDVGGAKSNAYCFINAEMPSDAWTLANNNDLGDLYEESDDCGGDEEEEMTETDGGVAEATEADAGM
jgi:hypothetical protein